MGVIRHIRRISYGIFFMRQHLFWVHHSNIGIFTHNNIQLRLKKFLVLPPVQFFPSDNTWTDRQVITKTRYDRKYMHVHTVMLLNMHNDLEIMHNKSHEI